MEDGFIKVYRSIDGWEHADQLAMIGFWVRLLLLASWEDTPKQRRGEIVTTASLLAGICHCNERTVRRYLQSLEDSGEIQAERSGNWTKIRIVNYEKYQGTAENAEGSGQRSGHRSGQRSGQRVGQNARTLDESHPYIDDKKKEERRNGYMANPTLDQIREYVYTENLMVDPDKFFDYYESQGWKLSNGNKMKDWKASCRNWHRKEVEKMNQEKKKGLAF